MIDFKSITLNEKELYEKYLFDEKERGCEYSFANLFMWGKQRYAVVNNHIVLFSQYYKRSVYPFPVGEGDKKAVLDAIMADSKERGLECRITGITKSDKELMESLYPDKFEYHRDRDFFDYVYAVEDLAQLKGRKYHGKKNHFNKFLATHPDYKTEPINEGNISKVRDMVDRWYKARIEELPDSDFTMEQKAIVKAFDNYNELGMEGIIITDNDEVLAMTMGSRLSDNTFDVHFEKALNGVDGTYAAINREFAVYITETHPKIEFLNREDDMGLEGLRAAKKSYRPHHMVEKWWADIGEDGNDC